MRVDNITQICSAMEMYLDLEASYSTTTPPSGRLSSVSISNIGVFGSSFTAPLSTGTYVTTMSAIAVSGFNNISVIAETIYPFVSSL